MFYFNVLRYIWRHRNELVFYNHLSSDYSESPMYQNYKDIISNETNNDNPLILKKYYDYGYYGDMVVNKIYTIEKDNVEGLLFGPNISLYYIAKFFAMIDISRIEIKDYFKCKKELKNRLKEISKSTRES